VAVYLPSRSLTVKLGNGSLTVQVPFGGADIFDASNFESAHFLSLSSPVIIVTLEVKP